MIKNKNYTIGFIIIVGVILTAGLLFIKNKSKKYTIGILQCASNKPLDTLSSSYIDTIKKLMGKNEVVIIHKNNENSILNAHTIAEQFKHNPDINLFLTIGGSASQSLAKVIKDRPIIVAGISDPQMYELEKYSNVCGIIDTFNYNAIFQMIQDNMPHGRSLAVIRSASDNAEKELLPFKELCRSNSLKYYDHAVYNESDIMFAAEMAAKNGDCIVIPCDTLVVSAFPYIANIAHKQEKPIFTCFIDGISMGASYATGVNYTKYGSDLAKLSYDILINKINPIEQFQLAEYDKVYIKEEKK